MRAPLRVGLSPPRCHVFGRRCHHGPPGVALVLVGARIGSPVLVLAGALLIATDLGDRRVWVSDFLAHPDWRR